MNGVLLANLFDLERKKAMGKKSIPTKDLMVNRVAKRPPTMSTEEQREAAMAGNIAFRKKQARLRKKAEEAAKMA